MPKDRFSKEGINFSRQVCTVVGRDYHVNMNGKEPSGPHPKGFGYKVNCRDSSHRRLQNRYEEWGACPCGASKTQQNDSRKASQKHS